jgi:hypothetical protein
MMTARLRAGRRLQAERAAFAGFGSPPFGFRAEGGDLVQDPADQETLSLIKRMHTAGQRLRAIAEALEGSPRDLPLATAVHPPVTRRLGARSFYHDDEPHFTITDAHNV